MGVNNLMDEKQKKLLIIWAGVLLPLLIVAIVSAILLSKPKGFGEGPSPSGPSEMSEESSKAPSEGATHVSSPSPPSSMMPSSQPPPEPSPPGGQPPQGVSAPPGGMMPMGGAGTAPQPQAAQAAPGEKLQEPGYESSADPFAPIYQPRKETPERPRYAMVLQPASPPEEKALKRIQWDTAGLPLLNVDVTPTGPEYWTAEGRRNLRGKRPEKEERAHEPLEAPYRMAGVLIDSSRVHAILEANERDHGVVRAGDSLPLSVLPAPGIERSEVRVVRIERDRMLVEDVDGQLKYVRMRPAGARPTTGAPGMPGAIGAPGGEMPQPWMQPGGMPQPWMQPGGMPQPWMPPGGMPQPEAGWMPPGGPPMQPWMQPGGQPWMQPGPQQPTTPGVRPGQPGGRRPFIRRPQQPRPEE